MWIWPASTLPLEAVSWPELSQGVTDQMQALPRLGLFFKGGGQQSSEMAGGRGAILGGLTGLLPVAGLLGGVQRQRGWLRTRRPPSFQARVRTQQLGTGELFVNQSRVQGLPAFRPPLRGPCRLFTHPGQAPQQRVHKVHGMSQDGVLPLDVRDYPLLGLPRKAPH